MNHLFTMRIISFDVGIKNLAYCVFSISATSHSPSYENHSIPERRMSGGSVQQSSQIKWSIPEWTCANLLSSSETPIANKYCCHPIKGKRKTDAEHPCNKTAKWLVPNDADKSYCELHAKMHGEWIIPKRAHSASHINKLKLVDLEKEYAGIYLNVDTSPTAKKMKKSELVERIVAYYESKCYRSATENVVKAKTAGETDLITIGRAIRRQLDGDPAIEGSTHVIIENQISTIAARMKTIQGMIAQYFIMRFGDAVYIEFVSSHNKLKGFVENKKECEGGKKTPSYKANKADGIAVCRRFFEANSEMEDWTAEFDKSKKRDDLADCFLQGIWYLNSNKIICYADNLKINSVIVS